MNYESRYWDAIFADAQRITPLDDGWLSKYIEVLRPGKTIVDLGCGCGTDTLALWRQGIRTVACDFSAVALERLRQEIPEAQTLCLDLTQPFPWASASVDVIIADLSLHYFSEKTTLAIGGELARVLKNSGTLLGRVNAFQEYIPSESDKEIEEHYYEVNGCKRRYFDVPEVLRLFPLFLISAVSESATDKYGKPKHVLEFSARKK